jgi:hypothetical protein
MEALASVNSHQHPADCAFDRQRQHRPQEQRQDHGDEQHAQSGQRQPGENVDKPAGLRRYIQPTNTAKASHCQDEPARADAAAKRDGTPG